MSLLKTVVVLAVWLSFAATGCRAQSEGSTTAQVHLDFRTSAPGVGATAPALYMASLRTRTMLIPGWRIETYSSHKYAASRVQEAVVTRDWGIQRVQAGLVRMPFGIYDYQETYASGLIDYPMPRTDYYHNFSLDWGVPGVRWSGGTANFQYEAAVMDGLATGVWNNQNKVGGAAARAQLYALGMIMGVSYWDGYYQPSWYDADDPTTPQRSREPVQIGGLDVRYTLPYVLLRGEYVQGHLGDKNTRGAYLDVFYHLPSFEKWTLAARIETLQADTDYPAARQGTLGARYTASPDWIYTLNWRLNNGVSAGWTPPTGRWGDLFLQVYRKVML